MNEKFQKALRVFSRIQPKFKAPSLHPDYILSDSLREVGVNPEFFIYENGGEVFYHGFELAKIPGTTNYDIRSPYGYGGAIATTENPEFLKKAWSNYSIWCRERNVVAELIRFHPVLENWKFSEQNSVLDRETVTVDLTPSNMLSTYETRARTAVRKAIKNGLGVTWETKEKFLEIFLKVYSESLKNIGANPFYSFPREYYDRLLASPISHMALCHKESKIIGVAIFLVDGDKMEYHLSGSTTDGKAFGATNLMLHEAFQRGQKLGCKVCHLGGGTNKESTNPLFFFKQGFSVHKSQFRIGERIHSPSDYGKLKDDWVNRRGPTNGRLLFYR